MTVAVVLNNPGRPRNVGTAVRACSCYGIPELLVTGTRVPLDGAKAKGYRLPREERMRDGRCVHVRRTERPMDEHPDLVPVAVEITRGAEMLPYFEHPAKALYVFGPEDGSISPGLMSACHRFVQVPMLHCANLASTVYVILNDRHTKRVLAGLEEPLTLRSEGWNEMASA